MSAHGRVIVGVGTGVAGAGLGAMLRPTSDALGRSRASGSAAALFNHVIGMRVGSLT